MGLFAVLALACTTPRTVVLPEPTPVPPSTTQAASGAAGVIADEIVARTNEERRANGLAALLRSPPLMRAAQIQADQMAAMGTMAHELPGSRYPNLGSRLAAVGYVMSAAGENIAEGHPTAASVVSGWMKSPGHRANMLDSRFTEMGAALAKSARGRSFWVQVFARPGSRTSR